jgi:hypothetical protein
MHVRREKTVRYVLLGLFFLFPLLSLLQLRDGDEAWREIARRARPSVVGIVADPEGPEGVVPPCGSAVLVAGSPVRAVVAGAAGPGLRSRAGDSGWLDWRPVYTDPLGRFTLLEAPGEVPGAQAVAPARAALASAGLAPVDPAAVGELVSGETGAVPAVLVGPSTANRDTLWVGELAPRVDPSGRTIYRGQRLRALRPAGGLAAAEADAGGAVRIDPALVGAPFVTREGVVLAIYLGEQDGGIVALPMGAVRDALGALDRHAAR